MQIDGYVQAVRQDLMRLAALGDEATGRAAELLAGALEPSLGLQLQTVLSEAALELSGQLEGGHVEVRISGGEPELLYVRDQGAEPAPEPGDDAFDARITLRLSESLKSRVEAAATAAGLSVNTWVVRALTRATESRAAGTTGRYRLTGHGRG